jgi:hypothetical protein
MAVAIAAFGAVILFAVHILAVPPGSLPIAGTMPAIIVPVILLFNRYMNPLQDHPFTRRCFPLECLAILMATIASNIAAIWILRPWLVGQSDYLALLGLGGFGMLVVALAATAAQAIVLRACAQGKDSPEGECR